MWQFLFSYAIEYAGGWRNVTPGWRAKTKKGTARSRPRLSIVCSHKSVLRRRSASTTGSTSWLAVAAHSLAHFFVFGELLCRKDFLHFRRHVSAKSLHLRAADLLIRLVAQFAHFLALFIKHRLDLRYLVGRQAQIRGKRLDAGTTAASLSASGRATGGLCVGGILCAHGDIRREHTAGDKRGNHQCFVQFHIYFGCLVRTAAGSVRRVIE